MLASYANVCLRSKVAADSKNDGQSARVGHMQAFCMQRRHTCKALSGV